VQVVVGALDGKNYFYRIKTFEYFEIYIVAIVVLMK
jgi:hypothetical protein